MDPNDSEYYRQHGQFEPYPPTSSTAIDFSTMSTTVSENSPNYNPYSSPVVQNTGNYITTSSSGFAPTEPTVSSMASPDYGGNAAHYRHPQHQQPQTFMPQQQQGFMPQQQTQGFAPQQPQGFASQQPQGFMPQQQQGYPPQQQQFGFPMSGVVSDPMMQNIAMQYGNTMLGQGKQVVAQSMEKYISLSRIKYYFAVDSAYVSRKIRLLFFPFTNSVSVVLFFRFINHICSKVSYISIRNSYKLEIDLSSYLQFCFRSFCMLPSLIVSTLGVLFSSLNYHCLLRPSLNTLDLFYSSPCLPHSMFVGAAIYCSLKHSRLSRVVVVVV